MPISRIKGWPKFLDDACAEVAFNRNHYWGRQPWYREHAQHHWAGREFHRPPPAGAAPKVGAEKGPKTGGPGTGKPAGAGRKVGAEKGVKGGGPGAGKPAGEHPKTGHPGKPE